VFLKDVAYQSPTCLGMDSQEQLCSDSAAYLVYILGMTGSGGGIFLLGSLRTPVLLTGLSQDENIVANSHGTFLF
jgi:hypothetical protein